MEVRLIDDSVILWSLSPSHEVDGIHSKVMEIPTRNHALMVAIVIGILHLS